MRCRLLFPIVAAFVTLCAAVAAAQAIPPIETSLAQNERAVASYFTQDSVGDVQLGRLGQERARNAAVRALAEAMVRDHTMTAQMGLEAARAIGADVRFKPGDDNQITLAHLAQFAGAEFDREYVKALIAAHQTDISTANDAVAFVRNPQLLSYLQQTLTVDRRHLAMAQTAQSRL